MCQKARNSFHAVLQPFARWLVVTGVLIVQILVSSIVQAQQVNSAPQYTSNIPSGEKLIRLPSGTTLEQFKKAHPNLYVVAVRRGKPGSSNAQGAQSSVPAPIKQWVNTLQHADGRIVASSPTTAPSRASVEWQYDIQRLKSLTREEQIADVNSLINKVPYVSDTKNYGVADHWATPSEFVTRGGDCEDYAIAKYASLRALGVPANQMHIAVVHDKNRPEYDAHAILVVHSNKGDIVLDNADRKIRNANDVKHYTPIMSVNGNNWWLNTDKNKP